MFGFARWGYSISPGYSSLVNTPAVSYTYRVDNVAGSNNSVSASVALEDPSRRDMADGVLADYGATYCAGRRRAGAVRIAERAAARRRRAARDPRRSRLGLLRFARSHVVGRRGDRRRRISLQVERRRSARRRATLTAASCCRSRRRAARSAISAFRSSPPTMSSAATATSKKRRAIPRSPPTSICGRRR